MLSRYSVTFSSSLSVTLHVQSVIAACPQTLYALEHSNLRFESIRYANRFESIRYANRFESIRLVKKIGLSIH